MCVIVYFCHRSTYIQYVSATIGLEPKWQEKRNNIITVEHKTLPFDEPPCTLHIYISGMWLFDHQLWIISRDKKYWKRNKSRVRPDKRKRSKMFASWSRIYTSKAGILNTPTQLLVLYNQTICTERDLDIYIYIYARERLVFLFLCLGGAWRPSKVQKLTFCIRTATKIKTLRLRLLVSFVFGWRLTTLPSSKSDLLHSQIQNLNF